MAGPVLDKKKDARYHVIAATNEWAAFVQAMMAEASNSPTSRGQRDAQRKRETTYAHGQLGGH